MRNGYKHIDTAAAYGNEKEVGQGIKASGVPRGEIFLTTKLDNPDQAHAAEALESSLSKLGTTYLDLCACLFFRGFILTLMHTILSIGLMHWPAPMTKDGKADKSVRPGYPYGYSPLFNPEIFPSR